LRALTEASGLRQSRRRLRFSTGHLFAAHVVFAITALIALRGVVDAHAGKASVQTPDRIAQQSALAQRHDASGDSRERDNRSPTERRELRADGRTGQGTQPSPQSQAQPRQLGMSQ
jgi:hypothetical protein